MFAAHKNFTKICDVLITFLNQTENPTKVVSYLNQQSKSADRFTALHYASFFGNLKLIRLLVENGADVSIVNDQAINMLHCAAQGDKPQSIAFFL